MSNAPSRFHTAALTFAVAWGWKIFPCHPGTKIPIPRNGFYAATDDLEKINEWWTRHPNANIAGCPEDQGLCVIETDDYKPSFDESSLRNLGLPPTYTIRSARGGSHRYFRGSLPPTQDRLGKGIDTRGQTSYMLLPPSVVDGQEYSIELDTGFAPLPANIRLEKAVGNKRPADAPPLNVALNTDWAIHRLKGLVEQNKVGIAKHGRNNLTYQIAAELIGDRGLPPDLAFTILAEHWNPHCVPPYPDDRLRTICEHVNSYAQNQGSDAVASAAETFRHANTGPNPEKPSRFRIWTGPELLNLPDPEWLVPDLIPEGNIGILSAAKGSFKSFLALDFSLAVATGLPGADWRALARGPAFYGAHEGFNILAKAHYPAWCKAKGIEPREDHGFFMLRGPRIGVKDEADEFIKAIGSKADAIGQAPRLIVLDTYSRCMIALDEGKDGDANRFANFCETLIEPWPKASALICAHKGKDTSKGTRGSSAFEAACDFVIDLIRTPESTLVSVKVRFMRAGREREMPWRLIGRTCEKSLVFEPEPPSEAITARRVHDIFDARNISMILRKMGATSDAIAVGTDALASVLTPRAQNESHEVHAAKCKATSAHLRTLAKSKLQDLCFGWRAGLKWCAKAEIAS